MERKSPLILLEVFIIIMRNIAIFFLLCYCLLLLSGCARFPSNLPPTNSPERTIYSSIRLNSAAGGAAQASAYYFLAIGIDQSAATGPVPVVTGIGNSNGWGTIAPLPVGQVQEPPFYIVCHNNSFAMYRQGIYIGQPFRSGIVNYNEIWVEFDLGLLTPLLNGDLTNKVIELNWITIASLDPPTIPGVIKDYDGFGADGNSYFTVPLDAATSWNSGVGTAVEEPAYGIFERTTANPNLDMIGWTIEVRRQTPNSVIVRQKVKKL